KAAPPASTMIMSPPATRNKKEVRSGLSTTALGAQATTYQPVSSERWVMVLYSTPSTVWSYQCEVEARSLASGRNRVRPVGTTPPEEVSTRLLRSTSAICQAAGSSRPE